MPLGNTSFIISPKIKFVFQCGHACDINHILLNDFDDKTGGYFTSFESILPSPERVRKKKCERGVKCTLVLSPQPFNEIFIMSIFK